MVSPGASSSIVSYGPGSVIRSPTGASSGRCRPASASSAVLVIGYDDDERVEVDRRPRLVVVVGHRSAHPDRPGLGELRGGQAVDGDRERRLVGRPIGAAAAVALRRSARATHRAGQPANVAATRAGNSDGRSTRRLYWPHLCESGPRAAAP